MERIDPGNNNNKKSGQPGNLREALLQAALSAQSDDTRAVVLDHVTRYLLVLTKKGLSVTVSFIK